MKKFIESILHLTKIFIAILVVVIIWFVPIAFPPNTAEQTPLQQSLPVLKIFASSADACPFACVKCTAWDPDAWPKNCLEYVCLADCEEELPPPTQPPTISHTLNCSLNGNNGWCKGDLSLNLTASDPQNAQVIISGTINGVAFACPTGNTTCSIPLSDGQGNITYRVDSSTGLSDSDTTIYKKDSTTPQINGNITGTSSLNSWYITSTILSATTTDLTSGISAFEMNINNTGWVSYAETTFNDGIHTIQYRATDNAGNVTETAVQEIKVDTITPVINISTTGTSGLNSWYTSNVILSATSNDNTSGISSFEINLNNTGWVNYAEITLTDGIHAIQYRATDNAGNTYTTAQQEIKVDTTTPSLSLSINGTNGQNDWYVSNVSVQANTSDSGAGISQIEAKIDNGQWSAVNGQLSFTDGIHTYQFKITDNAGNVTTTPSLTLKVDTIAPVIDMDDEIDLGDRLYYELQDAGSGLWINRTVIEDEDEKYKKIVWLEEISGYKIESDILWDGKFKDGTTAPVGEYFITLKIADQAGNETFRTAIVNVNPLSFLQIIPEFTPPTTNTELPSNELASNEQEESFGNESNGNSSNETTSTNVGGEIVFANTIAQAGTLTSFTSGNENTSTPITNTEILWGAMATAVVGATLAEWQRKREEEEARQRELDRIAQMEKNAERKAEKARLDYLNAAYQAKLDREKAKQNAVASARWNGIAKIEEAKQEAKKIASQNTFNHLMNEHKSQTGVYVSKVNAGGAKPLASPVRQEPEPPQSSWWDLLNPFWYFSDEPWPWETPSNTTIPSPIPNIVPSATFTPTITILPSATSTPGQPKIYAINGPMTLDQIPQEFRCTLPEKKIINGQELYSDYYYRCKLGEKLMVGLLTDPNGWWWQDGQTTRWDTGETTEWKSIKNNSDVWNLALALGLDAEGTDHRKQDSRFNELIEQAIFNKFWHFDHGVYSTYGNGVQDPDAGMPLGTNGRLVALGSLESLQKRVTGEDGFVTLNVHASYVIRPPYDGDSTNMWEDAWNYFENNGEPTWIEPPTTAPYEIGNINLDHPYYKSENVEEGMGKFEVLYRSSPNAASVRAIILTFEQFTDVYSQLPK